MPGLIIDKVGGGKLPHYGAPVLTLAELSALLLGNVTNDQRRYVASEGQDYYYNDEAITGDIAPDNQVGGVGFWIEDRKGKGRITLNSIQDLRDYANPTENIVVDVLGYYTPGDGSGGLFYFDPALIAEDNEGTVIVGWIRSVSYTHLTLPTNREV